MRKEDLLLFVLSTTAQSFRVLSLRRLLVPKTFSSSLMPASRVRHHVFLLGPQRATWICSRQEVRSSQQLRLASDVLSRPIENVHPSKTKPGYRILKLAAEMWTHFWTVAFNFPMSAGWNVKVCYRFLFLKYRLKNLAHFTFVQSEKWSPLPNSEF